MPTACCPMMTMTYLPTRLDAGQRGILSVLQTSPARWRCPDNHHIRFSPLQHNIEVMIDLTVPINSTMRPFPSGLDHLLSFVLKYIRQPYDLDIRYVFESGSMVPRALAATEVDRSGPDEANPKWCRSHDLLVLNCHSEAWDSNTCAWHVPAIRIARPEACVRALKLCTLPRFTNSSDVLISHFHETDFPLFMFLHICTRYCCRGMCKISLWFSDVNLRSPGVLLGKVKHHSATIIFNIHISHVSGFQFLTEARNADFQISIVYMRQLSLSGSV